MCGIVGMVGAYQNGLTNDEQNTFESMLFLDTQRGWDSTGVFQVSNHGNMRMKKAALHGPDFVRTQEFKAFMRQAWTDGMFVVGHNRAATRGTVSDENAHPFVIDDKIVLVQNGTYVGSHKHLKDTEVDTEAVAHVIATVDGIEEALQQINAAYCLAWYNIKDKTLNLIRNEQRPMFLGESSEGGWLFASEIETLFYSASRNKIKFKGVPKMIEPGELHQWELHHNKTWAYTSKKIDNKYRPKSPGATSPMGDDEYAAWEEYYLNKRPGFQRHEFYPVTVAKPTHIREVIKAINSRPAGQEKTIFNYVQGNKFHEFALDRQVSEALRDDLQASKPDSIVVEFVDYLPMREGQTGDHSRWIVYGKRITADETDVSPLVYMTIEGDETTALDFTINSLYTVTIPGGPVHHRVSPPNHVAYYMVTLFVSHPIPVTQLEVSEVGNH